MACGERKPQAMMPSIFSINQALSGLYNVHEYICYKKEENLLKSYII